MLDRLDDIIVAVSSAPGNAPLGIVRLSGRGAIALAEGMFQARTRRPWTDQPSWTRIAGEVLAAADVRLPAAAYLFREPHSYTRDDLVEIHTVGSAAALDLVRRRAIELGALPAQPGEFTARAFLRGRMSLTAAEGVATLIRARSDTQLRASRRLMDGVLYTSLTRISDELADLLALVEADIDFAEEPIEFITPAAFRGRIAAILAELRPMLAGNATHERLDTLPRILLLGRPNAGKSTLMNALSGTPRSICAPLAGTTRDLLSSPIAVGRGEALLVDAAGVDPCDDPVVAAARGLTLAAVEHVDLVCWVVDLGGAQDVFGAMVDLLKTARVVIAANKCDLSSSRDLARRVEELTALKLGPVFPVSALRGDGMDALRQAFAEALGCEETTSQSEALVLTERQRNAIAEAAGALHRAVEVSESARETIDCADLLAFELREALDAIGAVTGAVTTEDLLARVFANFCIGK